ncbi:hypothetical protein RhiXN_11443 [Rhizoctonia solani]|uniref:Uncharacterized protein n=1 Tax=Rhizoctonia solani TaxID=456999 RepID=A0A8H8P625_9AGAM|nr:uncharacterized protein RhiXN_11443 [Rhizoctonia solani]QRW24531.1 hypothetical protein RhiXN_11443 [Rhizoctonia solani]
MAGPSSRARTTTRFPLELVQGTNLPNKAFPNEPPVRNPTRGSDDARTTSTVVWPRINLLYTSFPALRVRHIIHDRRKTTRLRLWLRFWLRLRFIPRPDLRPGFMPHSSVDAHIDIDRTTKPPNSTTNPTNRRLAHREKRHPRPTPRGLHHHVFEPRQDAQTGLAMGRDWYRRSSLADRELEPEFKLMSIASSLWCVSQRHGGSGTYPDLGAPGQETSVRPQLLSKDGNGVKFLGRRTTSCRPCSGLHSTGTTANWACRGQEERKYEKTIVRTRFRVRGHGRRDMGMYVAKEPTAREAFPLHL